MIKKAIWVLFGITLLTALSYFIVNSYQEFKPLDDLVNSNDHLNFIKLSGGNTRIIRINNVNNARLLLIHGGGIAGSDIWRPNINFLTKNKYDILAFDQYGKGYSDRPRMKYSVKNLVGQLYEVLDSTKFCTRNFSVVSHSLGGMLAIELLVNNENKINNLIMLSPGLLGGFKPNPLLKIPIISNMIMTFYWYSKFIEGRRKEFYSEKKYNKYIEIIRPFSRTKGFKYVYRRTWIDILSEDVKQDLLIIPIDVQKKITIVFGREDPYYSVNSIPAMKEYLPYANYYVIDNVGHNINFEKPDTVNQLINSIINN